MRYTLPLLAVAVTLAAIAPASAGGLVIVQGRSDSSAHVAFGSDHDTSDFKVPGLGVEDNTPDFEIPGFNGSDDTPDFEIPGFIGGDAPPDPQIRGKFDFGVGSAPIDGKLKPGPLKGLFVPVGRPDAAAKGMDMPMLVSCKVAGTPSEFPDDIRITNVMGAIVPAGTRLRWSVPGGYGGVVTLSKSLAPGKTTGASGVIAGGVAAGTPCTIVSIGL